jgi:ABC-type multidrug transport system fused ATPase/permease subunit
MQRPQDAGGGQRAAFARLKPSAAQLRVLRGLWPYVWPSERPDLKTTVVLSLLLMLAAKLVTVAMPFTFKWATDALVAASGGKLPDSQTMAWLIGVPVLAIVIYGAVRIAMSLLVQVREGMFAKVAMHAVRKLALHTFEHMHALSLRFHLERKTGGLTRVLERGRLGIENISRMVLMTFVPTIVEFALVLGVCAYEFDWRYVTTVVTMIVLYLWFTIAATNWRIRIRRQMNESDTEANTKAIDSLLNYETVKYFGAEAREAARYDQSMAAYETASTKAYTSLAVLNAGQATIFTAALTLCMVMAGDGWAVRDGERASAATFHPAQFHGHGLPRDQTVAHRHRAHDGCTGGGARGGRQAGCAGAGREGRHHPLRECEVLL